MMKVSMLLVAVVHAAVQVEKATAQCTTRVNVNCDGSDLANGGIGIVKDVAACCNACNQRPDCHAFTKNGPNAQNANQCFLKADCKGAQTAHDGSVGGVTSGGHMPPVIDCKQGHVGPPPLPPARPLPRARPANKDPPSSH